MSTPTTSMTTAIAHQIKKRGNIHFADFVIHDTAATARLAINVPDVEKILFVKPSPNWNACTATCQ